MNRDIINWAQDQLQESFIVKKEVHGDRSNVFRLTGKKKNFFLKIGENFTKEYERLIWLENKLPVPKVIDFKNIDGYDVLLLSEIKGKNLKVLSKEWPAEKVVNKIVAAIKSFHNVDIISCPFGVPGEGAVLIHGDASLPNFIFNGDNFSGYIDLGDVAVGDKEIDFAAVIWSLQYNLGKGYGNMFLEKYGISNVTEKAVEKLRLQYEDTQRRWGLSI